MKKTILTAITILSVFGLSACGNVQKSDKEVSGVGTTTTASASVVTTVTTTGTTTVDEVTTSDTAVTTEPTTKTETTTTPIVTTGATTTTTVATSKKSTTTTTTAKKNNVTTTTKKQNTNNSGSSNNSTTKGTTMWVKLYNIWECPVYEVNGSSWRGIPDTYVTLGSKVTAYETVEIKSAGLTLRKCKLSDGSIYYIDVDDLCSSDPRATTYLTQSMVDKLVKELQEYSNEIGFEAQYNRTANSKKYKDKSEEEITARVNEIFKTDAETSTPENRGWDFPVSFDIHNPKCTYEYILEMMKSTIDAVYYSSPDSHVVIYARYYEDGFNWDGRYYSHEPCFTFFPIR